MTSCLRLLPTIALAGSCSLLRSPCHLCTYPLNSIVRIQRHPPRRLIRLQTGSLPEINAARRPPSPGPPGPFSPAAMDADPSGSWADLINQQTGLLCCLLRPLDPKYHRQHYPAPRLLLGGFLAPWRLGPPPGLPAAAARRPPPLFAAPAPRRRVRPAALPALDLRHTCRHQDPIHAPATSPALPAAVARRPPPLFAAPAPRRRVRPAALPALDLRHTCRHQDPIHAPPTSPALPAAVARRTPPLFAAPAPRRRARPAALPALDLRHTWRHQDPIHVSPTSPALPAAVAPGTLAPRTPPPPHFKTPTESCPRP
ncbi:hypothetical protein C8F04DRAFT_1263368 [Mycena alexandri]|uniref:Uncharacterized protein n=1 Tax=Mycena alexandri TaxID=1745969 RepID=A0AAD6SNL3_9AGAR|nr:hypothetical protein C8F04DRAFT_1263368 [Mycena alexandri]